MVVPCLEWRDICIGLDIPEVRGKSGGCNPFSPHSQGSIDFNTANTDCPVGMYFLIHPQGWINDERMVVHCIKLECIGLYIPNDLEISLSPRDVPLLVIGDVQPNTSLLSEVYAG